MRKEIKISDILEIMSLAEFSVDATVFFKDVYEKIAYNDELSKMFLSAREIYLEKYDCEELFEILDNISQKSGFHRFTVDMFLVICCMVHLKNVYLEKGYTVEFFAHLVKDINCKITECKKVHGFYGCQRLVWYKGFFALERFSLGRLQYEWIDSVYDYKDLVKKGDRILNVHIPSSGPLTRESVMESLGEAYKFYGPCCKGGLAVICTSWLIYPKTSRLCPKDSNIRKFYELFDIINEFEDKADSVRWRIFYTNTSDYKSLPKDTGLQKILYDYLNDGNHLGTGVGILVYNPDESEE